MGRAVRFLAVLVLLVAGCDSSPTEADPPVDPPPPDPPGDPVVCDLVALEAAPNASPVEPGRLAPALGDAADRLVLGLGASAETDALRETLEQLRDLVSGSDGFALCTAFNEMAAAVGDWANTHTSDHPGAPDFALVRLTAGVTEAAIREHVGDSVDESGQVAELADR